MRKSPPRQLIVALLGGGYDGGNSQAAVTALIDAIGGSDKASKCEELQLVTLKATELPENLGRLTGLKTLILDSCVSLVSSPDSISQLVAQEKLWLYGCRSLVGTGTVELRSGVQVNGEPAGLTVTYRNESDSAQCAEWEKPGGCFHVRPTGL